MGVRLRQVRIEPQRFEIGGTRLDQPLVGAEKKHHGARQCTPSCFLSAVFAGNFSMPIHDGKTVAGIAWIGAGCGFFFG